MKKYIVCDSWGAELMKFDTEPEAVRWIRQYAYHDGVHWIIYNVSRFPYRVSSRVLHLSAE
jgi:hypothetical protein